MISFQLFDNKIQFSMSECVFWVSGVVMQFAEDLERLCRALALNKPAGRFRDCRGRVRDLACLVVTMRQTRLHVPKREPTSSKMAHKTRTALGKRQPKVESAA